MENEVSGYFSKLQVILEFQLAKEKDGGWVEGSF